MMNEEPKAEHAWLQKMVGKWTSESECSMGPDQPMMQATGSNVVKSFGDFWIFDEGETGTPDGGTMTAAVTLGFDAIKGRFVGTFIGSFGSHLWVYDGAMMADGKTVALDAEGPSMAGDGSMAKYQDRMELVDDDHRVLTSWMLGPDGEWTQFVTVRYTRAS